MSSIQFRALSVFMLFLLGLFGRAAWQGWGDDFALYLQQALSLHDGSIHRLVERQQWLIAHTPADITPVVYPWGVPIMLWLGSLVTGSLIQVGWWINTIWLLAAMWSLLRFLEGIHGRLFSFLIASAIVAHPAVYLTINETGSDSIGFAIQMLVCFGWVDIGKSINQKNCRWWAISGGLLMGIALMVRLQLIALLPVFLLVLFQIPESRTTQKKALAIFSLCFAVFTIATFTSLPFPAYPKTIQSVVWLQPRHWISQCGIWWRTVWNEVLLGPQTYGTSTVVLVLAFIGLRKGWENVKWLLISYLLNLLMVFASLYPPVMRHNLLLVPLLAMLAVKGLSLLFSFIYSKHLKIKELTFAAGLLLVATGLYVASARMIARRDAIHETSGPYSRQFQKLVTTLKSSISPTLPVNFAKPRVVQYLLPNPAYYSPDTTVFKCLPSAVVLFRPELNFIAYPPSFVESLQQSNLWQVLYQDSSFIVFIPRGYKSFDH